MGAGRKERTSSGHEARKRERKAKEKIELGGASGSHSVALRWWKPFAAEIQSKNKNNIKIDAGVSKELHRLARVWACGKKI